MIHLISLEKLSTIIKKRKTTTFDKEVIENTQRILEDIRRHGLSSVQKWSMKFDKLKPVIYQKDDFKKSWKYFKDKELFIEFKKRIELFHKVQMPYPLEIDIGEVKLKLIWKPIERIGLYVPGGKYPYISTLFMGAIPAKIAGVKKIIVTSPIHDEKILDTYLASCYLLDIDKFVTVGGIQAIGGMAYGTFGYSVDKIIGPGNIYVQAAKRELYGTIGIDMIAGPTELIVLADETSPPERIAFDMLAQAEHGKHSIIILLDTSHKHMNQIYNIYIKYYNEDMAETYFTHITVLRDALDFINSFGPEHLLIASKKLIKVSEKIHNVGTISLLTPPAFSDYSAGLNHILPTKSVSRYRGALTVYDFLKPIQIIEGYDKEGLHFSSKISLLEGMNYHTKSLKTLE